MPLRTKLYLWAIIATSSLFIVGLSPTSANASVKVLQPGPEQGKDAQIVSNQPDTRFGLNPSLIQNWENARVVGLIEFDLTSIPAGATVHAATLSLYQKYNDLFGETYDVLRITSFWDQAVTFNTAPTFDPIPRSSLTIGDHGGEVFRSWDVTNLVAEWHLGTVSNFGMWIEKGTGTTYFSSSNATAAERPMLTISYSTVPEPTSLAACSVLAIGVFGVSIRRRNTSSHV